MADFFANTHIHTWQKKIFRVHSHAHYILSTINTIFHLTPNFYYKI